MDNGALSTHHAESDLPRRQENGAEKRDGRAHPFLIDRSGLDSQQSICWKLPKAGRKMLQVQQPMGPYGMDGREEE
jgi:hypothetical protein